jgi:NTE family protein
MRWKIPVSLLLLSLFGCASRFVCTKPVAPPALQQLRRELPACVVPARDFPFENLAIEGGGVKGIAYGGALEILSQAKILEPHKLKRVAGTSAGSITAALIALGYTSQDVQTILNGLDLEDFLQGGAWGLFRLFREFGFYSGEYYLDWVRCLVRNKTGDPNTTFQALHERNQKLGLPDLYVVTTDLTHAQWQVLSWETVPRMPVADAVRISGSLPFFWNALRFDLNDFGPPPAKGCVRLAKQQGRDVFADGGVLLNYPISLFDTACFVNGGDPHTEEINPKTLGLYLEAPPDEQTLSLTIDSLGDYAKALVETYLQAQIDYFNHNPCDQVRSVRIDNLGISTTDFNLTPAQKQALIRSGYNATCTYLQSWQPEKLEEACESALPSRSPLP